MRNRLSSVAVVLLVLIFAGCAGQAPRTPVERSLVLVAQYESLEETYKSQYRVSLPEEKEWLRKNVAPKLDAFRLAVIVYVDLVLAGDDATEARLTALDLLREVTLEMARRQDDSD